MTTPAQVYAATAALWNGGFEPYIAALMALRAAIQAATFPTTHEQLGGIVGALEATKQARANFEAFDRQWAEAMHAGLDTNDRDTVEAVVAANHLVQQWLQRADDNAAAATDEYRAWRAAAIAAQPDPGIMDSIAELTRAMAKLAEGIGKGSPIALPAGALAALGAVILAGLWWFRLRPAR